MEEMAEKNDDNSVKDLSSVKSNVKHKTKNNDKVADSSAHIEDEHLVNDINSMMYESALKKEENPFSFKRFLSQDAARYKQQEIKRNPHISGKSAICNQYLTSDDQHFLKNQINNGSNFVNSNDMASVLPDFVQDHLVIEQCYLNDSHSALNIDSFNYENLPDLNLEHRHSDLIQDQNHQENIPDNHSSNTGSANLPDFTLNMGNYPGQDDLEKFDNKILPDFTVNASARQSGARCGSIDIFQKIKIDNSTKRKSVPKSNGLLEGNSSNRTAACISSSPSVPLDLPLYDGADFNSTLQDSLEQHIPFDLTVAAEDRSNPKRGMPSSETVSKSLPDFLSDGPIQNDRLGENLQLENLNLVTENSNELQGVSHSQCTPDRYNRNELQNDVEILRRQLSDKNRRIHMLEIEIEDLRSRERRDASNLEYALLQMERNFKQTLKRASNAESALLKSNEENSRLRMELASLKSENPDLEIRGSASCSTALVGNKDNKIATELRNAATAAENSLRLLLTGIDDLRMIATRIENIESDKEKCNETHEDSASGLSL